MDGFQILDALYRYVLQFVLIQSKQNIMML